MKNKWTEEKTEKLRILLKTLSTEEVGNILGFSKRAVQNKAFRLKISCNDYKREIIKCLNCNKEKNCRKNDNMKFCSQSCSAIYSNKYRTEDSRKKQIKSLKKTLSLKPIIKKEKILQSNPKNKTKLILVNGKKKRVYINNNISNCKICNQKMFNSFRRFCSKCRYNYYKIYRVDCNFKFVINEYLFLFSEKELLNLKLLGMYSPTNKNNNLGGVSRDHIFSINEAYKLSINPCFISHPANCNLLVHSENSKKYINSDIILNDLYIKILESEKIKRFLNDDNLKTLTSLVESADGFAKSME